MAADGLRGIDVFLADLQEYEKVASDENIQEVLMAGGEALAEDVHKLPKPRRKGTGYTHMLDSVAAVPEGRTVRVGWGRHYGYFVEHGTKKMAAQPHLMKTWKDNQSKYYDLMKQKLFEKFGG